MLCESVDLQRDGSTGSKDVCLAGKCITYTAFFQWAVGQGLVFAGVDLVGVVAYVYTYGGRGVGCVCGCVGVGVGV